MPLGDGTVIETVINIFYAVDIDDVVVVLRQHAVELAPMLGHLRVRLVQNDRYQEEILSFVIGGEKP